MTVIKVPDLGGASDVEIIEVLVAAGDQIEEEQPLIVLETDKASMEIPADQAGVIAQLNIAVGDRVSQGDRILELQATSEVVKVDENDSTQAVEDLPKQTVEQPSTIESESELVASQNSESQPSSSTDNQLSNLTIPDLGGMSQVEVIEVCVAIGDQVSAEDPLIVLESDKASMDIPAPTGGIVEQVLLAVGDKVSEGDPLIVLSSNATASTATQPVSEQSGSEPQSVEQREQSVISTSQVSDSNTSTTPPQEIKKQPDTIEKLSSQFVYAGPAVRMFARELGVDLARVTGTGRRQRITKDDVQQHVKQRLTSDQPANQVAGGLPPVPEVDFSAFGNVSQQPLNAIKRATAKAMTLANLHVPQVTQFDQADITELETFRQQYNDQRTDDQPKLSIVPFVLKALASLLTRYPMFAASLNADNESVTLKQYCHIGVAVSTERGLLVPVIRNVDQLSVTDIAVQVMEQATAARAGKLDSTAMQGGCFTVSSLGGIGGTGFTPIVNPPQVAIIGLSVASHQPHWDGKTFVPRLMLPLSLSYDHRVIDGAEAAEFCSELTQYLNDIRRLLL